MAALSIVAVALGAFLGMTVQRSTGFGFGLAAVPVFSLVLGPFQGVLLANALVLPVAGAVLVGTWRALDRKRASVLMLTGALGVIPGVYVAKALPEFALRLFAGGVILLSIALKYRRAGARMWTRPSALVAVGAASGFLNGTAAAGGPPVAVYASANSWEHQRYVPTQQAAFIAINLMSVTLKGMPSIGLTELLICVAVLPVGAIAGKRLSLVLSSRLLNRVTVAIALAGACSLIIHAVWSLLA